MPIVASEAIVDAHTQRDGRRYVLERHTDQLGVVYTVGPYLIDDATFDESARLAQRAAEINAQLAQNDIDEALGGNPG